ncbi:hypothetical protein [Streptomyces sp. NRRL B-24484]|nr:hypothetical protein [Streptomyces sp. NRRL B-24484]
MIELTRSVLAAVVTVVIVVWHPQLDGASVPLLGSGFAAIAVPARRVGRR